ncbi:hypothetical protein ART_0709 [Arthrobacter sp. PAMC 25486]|uniref:DUF3099 domain-containing protein n=1 Tax=Arthrobacter sp. PAMC 25486 TaxID=1494608 RepID=UPI000535D09C|nr:DUF3099 domain-containing protein [Arthrobacter sp. PAMC 25486]AIY00308.1 hypothetical protein ART_0709 [Arthrobacter sp. PAMC 25486]
MKDQSATPKFGAGRRSKYRHSAPDTGVQAITNAADPHSEDMRRRMVQYSVTMGIRMVCLAAIFVFDGWFKLVPIIGAVVLPWVAVMIANSGADINAHETVELLDEAPLYSLGVGDPETFDGAPSPGDILTGELVPDTDEDTPAGESTPANGEDNFAGEGTPPAGAYAAGGFAWPMGPGIPSDPTEPAQEAAQEEKHHEHL